MSIKLDRAIEAFEDESLGFTLGERISILRDALIDNAYEAIKKINTYGLKHPISEEEEYKQTQCMKQLRIIERMYDSQVKNNRMVGRLEEVVSAMSFLKKVKEQKSSIGDIVGSTQVNDNGQQ